MLSSIMFTLIFVAIGCVFLYGAVVQYKRRIFLKENGISTVGTIIHLEQGSDPESHIWYPVVRFTTLNREIITIRHNFGTQPASYQVGQQIQIVYDPSAPKEFVIGTDGIAWESYIFGFIGVVLISVGLYKCFALSF